MEVPPLSTRDALGIKRKQRNSTALTDGNKSLNKSSGLLKFSTLLKDDLKTVSSVVPEMKKALDGSLSQKKN